MSTFVIPASSLLAVWLNRWTPYENFGESLARSWDAVALSFAIPILVATVVAFGKNRRVAGTLGVLATGIPMVEWVIIVILFREPCPPLDEWCGFGRGYGTLAMIVCTAPVVLLFAIAAVIGACRRPRES